MRDGRPRLTCSVKLEALRWASCDWFEVSGIRFGVRSTSAPFGEWLRLVLSDHRAAGPRDPSDAATYSLVVEDPERPRGRATRNLHVLYRGTFSVVRSLDVSVVARSFLSEIASLTFPARDDAVYLGVSLISGPATTALIPTRFVPAIAVAGRRIQQALDIGLPDQLWVALDLETGHLVPARWSLSIPGDALDLLGRFSPVVDAGDRRATVDREFPVDTVLVWGRERGVHAAPKGPVLFELAHEIRNLDRVGRRGVIALGRALSDAQVRSVSWFGTAELIETLRMAVDGATYVRSRTELTSVGS